MKQTIERAAKSLLGLGPPAARTLLHRVSAATLSPAARQVYDDVATVVDMGLGLTLWRDRGFRPAFVVDCGAYQGEWARLARSVWPDAAVALIEPQAGKAEGLRAACQSLGGDCTLYPVLVGPDERDDVRFVEMETGSSVLDELSDVNRHAVTHRQTTLTALAAKHNWPPIGLLKLDVQGYEVAVLRGAAGVLPTTDLVLAECSVVQMNQGAPHLREVMDLLGGHGFELVDVVGLHRRPGDRATTQVDAAFARRDGPAWPKPGWF